MVKLLFNKIGNGKYYRITYNGDGIYNALKNNISLDIWKRILLNDDISWLPKPPNYSSKNISYFTEKGYEKFSKKVMPIITNYLEKEKIKVETFDKISNPILYSDEYQIVVDINNK